MVCLLSPWLLFHHHEMQVFYTILFWWLQHLTYWVYSSNDMAQVMHTSMKDSVASDVTEVGIGIRPGKGSCTLTAAKSSDGLTLALPQICLCFFPFQMLLAFSNALDKHFSDFSQVCWCLVSTLACKKEWSHGHVYSSGKVTSSGTAINSERLLLPIVRSRRSLVNKPSLHMKPFVMVGHQGSHWQSSAVCYVI